MPLLPRRDREKRRLLPFLWGWFGTTGENEAEGQCSDGASKRQSGIQCDEHRVRAFARGDGLLLFCRTQSLHAGCHCDVVDVGAYPAAGRTALFLAAHDANGLPEAIQCVFHQEQEHDDATFPR